MSTVTTPRPGRTRPTINPRIAERRAEVRRERMLRRRRRSLFLLAVAAVLAVLAALERSPLLTVTEVRVEGTQRLRAEVVEEAAALPLPTSTLRLRLGPAERRVEALPLVADATVRRSDPLTVVIDVTERVPVALLLTRGRPALVDADGVVIAHEDEAGLPVIVAGVARPPATGATIADAPAAANAFAVARALPAAVRDRVVRYEAATRDDVVLVLAEGVRVRFGRAQRTEEKVRVLTALLGRGEPLARIDLRAPSNPVVVPGEPADDPSAAPTA